MQVAAASILSIQAIAQTGTVKPVAEVNLKPLGVSVPAQRSVSATAMELLFLSDSHLVVLEENARPGQSPDAHLMLYEIEKSGIRQKKSASLPEGVMPISLSNTVHEKVLEWVDSDHFAYWTYLGKSVRWLCDSDLNCRDTKEGPSSITLSHAGECTSGDLLGFIDVERAVCLVPRADAKWSAIVMGPSGHHLYEVEQGALPWDARMVSSVQGQRFGLEWESNTFLQLLNPVACIDECPPAGRQHFVVFNSTDGRNAQSFEWDPRHYNLHVLPAISPPGKTAALVSTDKLAIYSLDSLH